MRGPSLIPHSPGNASSFQVVGRQLHEDLVARHDADEVHPHLAADVREHRVPVLELDLEHRVWKGFGNGPLHFDDFFVARLTRQLRSRHRLTRGICQREPKVYQDRPLLGNTHQAATASPSPGTVTTTGPAAVQASVCSKCAERLRSAVTTVHWSSSVRVSGPPTLTIGSIAMQSPSPIGGVGCFLAGIVFCTLGSSCVLLPHTRTDHILNIRQTRHRT